MDCVYISEGSYLWKHNDAIIYLRGICHEEDSIIFKVLSFNAIFNSMQTVDIVLREIMFLGAFFSLVRRCFV